MNILVLNGSPKGDNSVTMSYIKYLKVVYPEYDFQTRQIAGRSKRVREAALTKLSDQKVKITN